MKKIGCYLCLLLLFSASIAQIIVYCNKLDEAVHNRNVKINETLEEIHNIQDEIKTENKVLVIKFVTDDDGEATDLIMVKNALNNGGMIVVKNSSDTIDLLFGNEYKNYGAANNSGQFYTMGALLNYISSLGWKLTDTSSTLLESVYYFTK